MAEIRHDFYIHSNETGKYYCRVLINDNDLIFQSEAYENQSHAIKEAEEWFRWSQDVVNGNADCIYYIVAVPHDFISSRLIRSHPYSGLRVKIGYSKHPEKRVRELQTGTMDKLILHALEPGSRQLELKRHAQFAAHRRNGEWFLCSSALAQHILDIWSKYRVLPPEHQHNVLELVELIKIYQGVHRLMDGPPDLINPPLDVPWHGKVFLDLRDIDGGKST